MIVGYTLKKYAALIKIDNNFIIEIKPENKFQIGEHVIALILIDK